MNRALSKKDFDVINSSLWNSKDDTLYDLNGITRKRISHAGVKRRYLIYLPSNLSSKESVPLVFNFHGFGDSAEGNFFCPIGAHCLSSLASF